MSRTPCDLTNQYFGCLKAIRPTGEKYGSSLVWECYCDPEKGGCGATCKKHQGYLAKAAFPSCGCLTSEMRRKSMKEAHLRSPAMKELCNLNRERNEAIYEAWQKGESAGLLEEKYGITKQRVYQIVQKEAARRGEPLRTELGVYASNRRQNHIVLPPELVESWRTGEITTREASEQQGISVRYFCKLARLQYGVHSPYYDLLSERTQQRNADIYAKFMAGSSLKELALEYGVSTAVIHQRLHKHRTLTGAPSKYPNRGKTKSIA